MSVEVFGAGEAASLRMEFNSDEGVCGLQQTAQPAYRAGVLWVFFSSPAALTGAQSRIPV